MLLLLLFLLFLSFSCIFLLHKKHKNYDSFHPPPGPKGLPFIGNIHQFDSFQPHIYLSKLSKIYGPILTLKFGRKPIIVIQSAQTAEQVLKTQDLNFCSRPKLIASQRIAYNGLDIAFVPYNEYYKEVRKICVVHLLNSNRVQSYAPIRQDEVSRLVESISTLSSCSEIVNLSELAMNYANSNICRVAFGKRFDNIEASKRRKFYGLLHEIQALFIGFFFTDYFPWISWLDKLTGQKSRLERAFDELNKFNDELINDHLDPNRPKSDQEDIIEVLLHLRKDRSFGFDLTLNHIKALLMDIVVAGTDTSAAMIVWAMTELLKNPEIMTKVQEEIRKTIHDKDYNRVTMDDLPNLTYFKAVVKETFRFHPAAPLLIVRETVRQCVVNGYDILPKTLVYINVWAIGRDPECWNDPEKFIPERFLGSSVDYKGQDFGLIPFGAGRRMCPGLVLGVANFELALANILYSFDWDLPKGVDKDDLDDVVLPGIAMHKKNHLCLVAKHHA
ncbi:cytochrome P450 83B1-like [Silene latifolia]|uniref:cytochrome P450 83B1-like n=1 Tax=Silene latifolia TaxID=37657 RepID=UPI003D773303